MIGNDRSLAQRIGIMQGRLVPSHTGELDCSPGERWPDEFAIAADIGLSHIELVAERHPDEANPIWSAAGRQRVKAVAESSRVGVRSMCVNEPLNARFDQDGYATSLARRLTPVIVDTGLTVVVIPLLETSDLTGLDWARAARSVRLIAAAWRPLGARPVLELGVSADESLRFVSAVADPEVGLCYDLGNATAHGLDVPAELRTLGAHVRHVHAKDKDDAGQNVRFGTGRVRFVEALAELNAAGYGGLFTMEATRGDDPMATAAQHRAFLLARQPAQTT